MVGSYPPSIYPSPVRGDPAPPCASSPVFYPNNFDECFQYVEAKDRFPKYNNPKHLIARTDSDLFPTRGIPPSSVGRRFAAKFGEGTPGCTPSLSRHSSLRSSMSHSQGWKESSRREQQPDQRGGRMATRDPEESYFSYSASARGDGLRRPPSRDGSVDELLFVFSACSTPVTETTSTKDSVYTAVGGHRHKHSLETTRTGRSTNDNRNTYGSPNNIAMERSRWSPAGQTERTSTTFTKALPDQARSDAGNREEFERKAGSRRPRREPRISTGAIVDFTHSPSTSPETRAGQGLPAPPPICPEHEDTDVRRKARGPERRTVLPWRTRTAPVVDAYNPTGIPGSAATLGKYYPSNYEASDAADSPLQSPGAASQSAAPPPGSAQEHQLMQYKRDMISQTLQTAREALGRTKQRQVSVKAVDRVLDEGSRKSIASGVALLRRYKPSSPRITPLLSPGPVTPMALDESEERDYLSVKVVRPR